LRSGEPQPLGGQSSPAIVCPGPFDDLRVIRGRLEPDKAHPLSIRHAASTRRQLLLGTVQQMSMCTNQGREGNEDGNTLQIILPIPSTLFYNRRANPLEFPCLGLLVVSITEPAWLDSDVCGRCPLGVGSAGCNGPAQRPAEEAEQMFNRSGRLGQNHETASTIIKNQELRQEKPFTQMRSIVKPCLHRNSAMYPTLMRKERCRRDNSVDPRSSMIGKVWVDPPEPWRQFSRGLAQPVI